jgi:hypothetical protein
MQKLTLDLDELTVESFPTANAPENGTAEAFSTPSDCKYCPATP